MLKQKRGIAPILLLIIALLAVAGGGAYYINKKQKERVVPPGKEEAKDNMMQGGGMMKKNEAVFVLDLLNNSGQRGRAALTDVDGKKTKVVIEIESGAAGVAQPAHIHMGSCPNPGEVVYPLKNVVNGRSETMLDVSMLTLKEKLPLAINVHKSAADVKTYVSCGNLPKDKFDSLDMSMMMKKGEGMMDESAMMKAKTHKVEMTSAGFSPKELTIKKGDIVEFINKDSRKHWPASGIHPTHLICGGFDALKGIDTGATYSHTFTESKICPMHDHLIPNLFGKITVE